MPRRPRCFLPDGVFHVTVRGVARLEIFLDTLHYRTFFDTFDATSLRFEWYCHRYCALPNHFHLIVETTRERLSKGMHRVNFLYAQWFNAVHNRSGHVFQNRFGARVVETEEYFEAACEYVDLNPVRAGLCARPEEWPWSSAYEAAQTAASVQPIST
jgi:REP element-mobilizing transposase RayT